MPLRAVPAVVAAMTVLAGCGGSSEAPRPEPAVASGQDAATPFPVTIEHAFGATTIEERPERVVTLGWSAQDVVYALGGAPVGMPAYPYGGDEDGVLPWNADLYQPEDTTLLDTADGEPLEAIAALRPDVILAPYAGFEAAVYEDLSAIAPTVAYPDEPWTTPWRAQTRMIGEALGESEAAEQLVGDVEDTLARTAAEHPQLEGLTFAYTSMGSELMYVYLPSDPRVQLVESLGMVVAPSVQELAAGTDEGQFYAEVSLEQAPEITSDVLICFTDDLTPSQVSDSPIYSRLPALQSDAAVLIDDQGFGAAVSSVSVLSIPWALDRLVTRLATASDNAGAS